MNSFLATFKPKSENAARGWPLEELQELVRRLQGGEAVVEDWRFRNKNCAIGDRVFVLLQGKRGPAIIGYGKIVGPTKVVEGRRFAPVGFDVLLDPTKEALASAFDLEEIADSRRYWRTQSSGVLLPPAIAEEVSARVVGAVAKPLVVEDGSNPDWTTDELILALNLYLKHRPNPPDKNSTEVAALSKTLNLLGKTIFNASDLTRTFRNENGVYMKLMNFRRLDPQYTGSGKKGLDRGAKGEEAVWSRFADDPKRCQEVADAIVASLTDTNAEDQWQDVEILDDCEEAAEGRVFTKKHLARERSRKLVRTKCRQAMKKLGKLACEVCGFDFAKHFGDRGHGFIECHHTRPVSSLVAGTKTNVNELALVCANCHRMIHRRQPWLSVAELKKLANYS